jgi:hypothetical protein
LFGILVAVGGYLIVDIIAISMYDPDCNPLNPNLTCYNIDMKPINYVMFWFGVLLIIMILFYLIFMPCYVLNVVQDCQKLSVNKRRARRASNASSSCGGSTIVDEENVIKHGSLYRQNNVCDHGQINYCDPYFTKNVVVTANSKNCV